MHIAFFCSAKSRCQAFARIFAKGLEKHGHTMDIRNVYQPVIRGQDISVILGVQQKETFELFKRHDMPLVYFDKGYTRTWDYRRVALNDAQPTAYMPYWSNSDDRRKKFNWEFEPWRRNGEHIVIATSSTNYHAFRGLPTIEEHTRAIVSELRTYTSRPIVFRQKPNQTLRVNVKGTTSSILTLREELEKAHCLITYGSSASLTAMQMGIPSIVLGDAVLRSISSNKLKYIESPCYATDWERERLLNNLAYCQWSLDEFESGEAWDNINAQLKLVDYLPWL